MSESTQLRWVRVRGVERVEGEVCVPVIDVAAWLLDDALELALNGAGDPDVNPAALDACVMHVRALSERLLATLERVESL